MINVFASDMDGTLLDSRGQFDNSRFYKQLQQMYTNGQHFICASSNQYAHLLNLFADAPSPISYICTNGSLVVNEQGVIVAQHFIEQSLLQRAVEWLLQRPDGPLAHLIVITQNGAYTNLPSTHPMFITGRAFYENMTAVKDLTMVFDLAYKIDLMYEQDLADIKEVIRAFNREFAGQLSAVSSGMNGIDIMAAGVSKAQGIEKLLTQWQLDMSNVMAFGDNGNDLDMIMAANKGYAMKNAASDLLQRAPLITNKTNDEQGVLEVIDEYLI